MIILAEIYGARKLHNRSKTFFNSKFFKLFVKNNLGLDCIWIQQILDTGPDPISVNLDPNHCLHV